MPERLEPNSLTSRQQRMEVAISVVNLTDKTEYIIRRHGTNSICDDQEKLYRVSMHRGLGPPERMRLRVQDIVVQANHIRRGEHQVEILERLSQPEAL